MEPPTPTPSTPSAPSADAVLDEVVTALRRGDAARAERALAAGPEPPAAEAMVRLAELNMRRRRWHDAAWLFDHAAELRRDGRVEALPVEEPRLPSGNTAPRCTSCWSTSPRPAATPSAPPQPACPPSSAGARTAAAVSLSPGNDPRRRRGRRDGGAAAVPGHRPGVRPVRGGRRLPAARLGPRRDAAAPRHAPARLRPGARPASAAPRDDDPRLHRAPRGRSSRSGSSGSSGRAGRKTWRRRSHATPTSAARWRPCRWVWKGRRCGPASGRRR